MMKNDGIPTGVSKVDLSLPLPTEWREVGKIEKLFIYPLKSARGHIVDKAQVLITICCELKVVGSNFTK
jgi:hypothetical protein